MAQIPTVKLHGKFVIYFAVFKDHISLYPIPKGTQEFEKEIAPYIHGKGTMRFSIDKPIPYDLIEEIVKFGLEANRERYGKKQ